VNAESNQLILQVRAGGKEALAGIYKAYRTDFIQWIAASYSCGTEEAKDVYQQCIIIFYENVISGKLQNLTSSVKTYLFSIGKNKMRELQRQRARTTKLKVQDLDLSGDSADEAMLQRIESCVEKLGEPCRSLLIQFYYHKQTMDHLKELFGYRNVETAKNQKYKCLERLRNMVKEQQLTSAS
jgi:RNA polymerase sigma factor (sigma-70 family)